MKTAVKSTYRSTDYLRNTSQKKHLGGTCIFFFCTTSVQLHLLCCCCCWHSTARSRSYNL